MITESIILFVIWVIATETIYFSIRDDHDDFWEEKFTAMFISAAILWFSYGMPRVFTLSEECSPWIVFAWYYGIIGAITLFYGSNWLISKKLHQNKIKAKRKGKKK